MEISIILAVAFIWGIAVIIPGPNFFITVQYAISKEDYSSLFVVFGILVSTIIWIVLSFYGLTLLLKNAPNFYMAFKILSGIYLIYLGLRLIVSKSSKKKIEANKEKKSSYFKCFLVGMITSLSNPKTAMFITSLFATITTVNTTNIQMLTIALTILIISSIWYGFVMLVFKKEYFRSIYLHYKNTIEFISGFIFIYFGAKAIFSE